MLAGLLGFLFLKVCPSPWCLSFGAWGQAPEPRGWGLPLAVHTPMGARGWNCSWVGPGGRDTRPRRFAEPRGASAHRTGTWRRDLQPGPGWAGGEGRPQNCVGIIPKERGGVKGSRGAAAAHTSTLLRPNCAPGPLRSPGPAREDARWRAGLGAQRSRGMEEQLPWETDGRESAGPRCVCGESGAGRGPEHTSHPWAPKLLLAQSTWPPSSQASLWRRKKRAAGRGDIGRAPGTRGRQPLGEQ